LSGIDCYWRDIEARYHFIQSENNNKNLTKHEACATFMTKVITLLKGDQQDLNLLLNFLNNFTIIHELYILLQIIFPLKNTLIDVQKRAEASSASSHTPHRIANQSQFSYKF
jgi:hypothetical protein